MDAERVRRVKEYVKSKSKSNKISTYAMANPISKINKFKSLGYDFKVSTTSRSYKIHDKTNNIYYVSGGKDYTFKEFNLQKKLKRNILENINKKDLRIPDYTEKDITYKKYSDRVLNLVDGEILDNVVEFDISKAYYECAHNLGYIDDSMYRDCLEMDKKKRLRFLGSMATQKTIYEYKGGVLQEDSFEYVTNDILRSVWFHICKHVDDCLMDLSELLGDKFYLYYVDGIYFEPFENMERFIREFQVKWKFVFVKNIVDSITMVSNSNGKGDEYCTLMIKKYSGNEMKEKPFFLVKGGKNKISKGYHEDVVRKALKRDKNE